MTTLSVEYTDTRTNAPAAPADVDQSVPLVTVKVPASDVATFTECVAYPALWCVLVAVLLFDAPAWVTVPVIVAAIVGIGASLLRRVQAVSQDGDQ